jgi:bifunctional DNA-binding transcriptional regulator/antitoxin component of YhaV-PrlF toxin-antitoxin module
MKDGTAPESLRRKGARGDLPVSLGEKFEILVFLSSHPDVEIRQQALHSLRYWNNRELDQVLSDPSTSPAVIDFVFDRLMEEQQHLREAQAQGATASGSLPPPVDTQEFEAGSTSSAAADSGLTVTLSSATAQGSEGGAETNRSHETLLEKIARLTVPQKVRRALVGSQEERLILIRDSNRVVVRSVIQSPKLSDSEIESFAAMRNVQEEVLRGISKNRVFIKNPAVIRALVFNPRSPIDVSLPLIKLLKDRDLKLLTIDKNVPDAVRNSAVRLHSTRTQDRSH